MGLNSLFIRIFENLISGYFCIHVLNFLFYPEMITLQFAFYPFSVTEKFTSKRNPDENENLARECKNTPKSSFRKSG